MLDLNDNVKLNENIILKSVHDKFWCLDTVSGTQYKINRVAYDILSNANEDTNISDVIDKIYPKYKVSKDIFIDDVKSLLNVALDKKILLAGGE